MTRIPTLVAGLLLCAGALPAAHAACGPAPQPAFAIPDGAHASKDEMSAAKDNLSEYSAQVAAYASCLGAQRRLRDADLGRGSAALVRLASVVSCFTLQVRAFQATGGGRDAGPARCSLTETARTAAGEGRRTPLAE